MSSNFFACAPVDFEALKMKGYISIESGAFELVSSVRVEQREQKPPPVVVPVGAKRDKAAAKQLGNVNVNVETFEEPVHCGSGVLEITTFGFNPQICFDRLRIGDANDFLV